MATFDNRQQGQKLNIGATEWNRLMEIARADITARADGGPVPIEQDIVPVYVWNNTVTDVARYGVIGVAVASGGGAHQTALIGRTTNSEEFMNRPSLIGTTPRVESPSTVQTLFVIALEPIPKGTYGRCAIAASLIPVQVNFPTGTTTYEWANVKDSDLTQLQACAHGPARIIHKDSGSSGTIWCLVQLGNHQRPVRLGTIGVTTNGWTAAGGYTEVAQGALVRDTANDDFDSRETLPATVNLARYSGAAYGLMIGDRGEWWSLPFYDNGVRCSVTGLCELSDSSETAGNWSYGTPSLDTAELIESLTSTELKLRYAGSYSFRWKIQVTCDFAAPTAAGDPPTQTEFNTLVTRLTSWCRFEPPVASSGTLSAINGVTTYEAHNMGELALEIPISSTGRKDHYFEMHANASEGAVLAPPRFQAGDGVTINYQVIIEGISSHVKIDT